MNRVVAAESQRTPSRSSTMVGIAVAIRNQAIACSATPKLVAQTIRALSPESSAHIVGRSSISEAVVILCAGNRVAARRRGNFRVRYRVANTGSSRKDRSHDADAAVWRHRDAAVERARSIAVERPATWTASCAVSSFASNVAQLEKQTLFKLPCV